MDASYEVVLRRHLAENFIQAEVQGYHQGLELIDKTESNTQDEEAQAIGKATRIISSLASLLKNHQVIISQNAFLDDLNSIPRNNFNYKFFFQLASVIIPPDTKKYRHDDRVDATASAVTYLYKKREEGKKKKTAYKSKRGFLELAKMYSQEKKLKTGEKQIQKLKKLIIIMQNNIRGNMPPNLLMIVLIWIKKELIQWFYANVKWGGCR
ncbi:MAG: hypothetical protein ACYC2U_07920 [Candidatus Amoebophilus sp.]